MYGPVLGLKLGNQKLVVISTHDLVKQVLLQNEFNGRPDGFFFRVRSFGKRKGISIFLSGVIEEMNCFVIPSQGFYLPKARRGPNVVSLRYVIYGTLV